LCFKRQNIMYYIIYLSAATQWPSESELTDILSVSRVNNSRKGITGILLYGNGRFIQVLEGDKALLQETFNIISKDSRHKGITQIASGELKERNFANWSMGFKSVNACVLSILEGYINPSGKQLLANGEHELPIKLLKSFVRTNRLAS